MNRQYNIAIPFTVYRSLLFRNVMRELLQRFNFVYDIEFPPITELILIPLD